MDDLRHFIASRIRDEGPVTFARFMDWCLYHPAYGYYSSGAAKIGKEGDFYTAPCVHPLFGGMLARQLCQMGDLLSDNTFTILEIGGGRGFLCADIMAWIENHEPSLFERLEYFIVESSNVFCEEQQQRLADKRGRGKVRWLPTDALRNGNLSVTGCILSNELVDAFPVHRVVSQGGELKEIRVDEQDGSFIERWDPLTDSRLGEYLSDLGIGLAEGQKAEVNLRALAWLEEVERCLKRGFLMTIDYGGRSCELYNLRRQEGTLRCFYRHQLHDSPYENVGRQDITAHVDFTSLIRKGEEVGLLFTGLVPQYRFLMALGFLDEIAAATEKLPALEALQLRLSLKCLIEPELGMGEIFKVLIQHKGMKQPALRGLRELRDI